MNSLKKIFRKKHLSKDEMKHLVVFEKKLGFSFHDIRLLKRSLSHKSYTNELKLGQSEHNERLEFLGDAVLELAISDFLFETFPKSREGRMSKIRASLVNEMALAERARFLDLGDYLYLGKGEEQANGREKNSLLSDAFEALLGAMFLDSGFEPVYSLVKKLFRDDIKRATKEDISKDYKTKLQEAVQNRHKTSPDYRLIQESGPDHNKTFEVHLYVQNRKLSRGVGKSKKQAEQKAAEKALKEF